MKNKKRTKSVVFIILVVLCVCLLVFSLYQALVIYIPQTQEQAGFEKLRSQITQSDEYTTDPESGELKRYSAVSSQNTDLKGWLKIYDTVIDYPVMKSSEDDSEYYLHRDFNRAYSYSGSLFIGNGCDVDSDVFIIYGHNMNNGSMFGGLDEYMDETKAEFRQDIIFDTLEEHRVYRVFAAFQDEIHDEEYKGYKYYESVGDFSEKEYYDIVNSIKGMSLIDIGNSPVHPGQILLLSTCSYHSDNGRFVVAAYRIA